MGCCPDQVVLPAVLGCEGSIRAIDSDESLYIKLETVILTASATLRELPQLVFISSGADATLPPPVAGLVITIKNTDGSLSSDAVAPAGANVEGGADITISAGGSATVVADGTNWWSV